MATLEQIGDALRKADAAGNVEDARRLAAAYRAQQAADAQPTPEGEAAMSALDEKLRTPFKPMTRSGPIENISAGLNDALYTVAGFPVDASRNAINWGIAGVNKLRGADDLTEGMIPDDGVLSKNWFNQRFQQIGVMDPERVVPANTLERILRAGGEGVGYAVAPEAMLAALSKAGIVGTRAENILGQVFGKGESVRGTAGNALAGFGGGVGAQYGAEAAPESLKPLATLAGGVGGAGLTTLATGIPRAVRAGGELAADFLAPITQGGRERLAGRQLREGATNPGQVLDDIETQPADLVPGAEPTTGQVTGDMGLLAMERAAASKDPATFQQRRADQNAARTRAVEGLQGDGAPEAVASQLRSVLDDVDRMTAASVDEARQGAVRSGEGVGTPMRPEVAGETLRRGLDARRADAVEIERRIWEAVDPDRNLVLAPVATKDAVAAINKEHSGLAKAFGSEENAIYQAIGTTEEAVAFQDFAALRSRVSQAMADERAAHGKSPAWARLTQLRGAIEHDLENAVANKVMLEQQAVARGELAVESTAEYRLAQERAQWYAARDARASGADGGSNTRADGGGRPPAVSRARGAEGTQFSGPGNASRDPGLPQDARGAGAKGLTLADIRSMKADDPFFVRSNDGQTFVPVAPGNADLGVAPVPETGQSAPIRVRRRDLIQHIGNAVHRADAEILGYPDQWAMTRDVAANWDRMHRAVDGKLMLVKLNTDLRHGAAVIELAPVDGGSYYRIASVGRRSPSQMGELIDDRLNYPNDGSGSPSPSGSRSPTENRAGGDLIKGVDQSGEYTPQRPAVQQRPFDDASMARLRRATEATKTRANTFDNAQLAPLQARSADHAAPPMLSSSVAASIFRPGSGGYQRIQTYLRANNTREAKQAIEGYAIEQMRAKALRDDGTLDPAKLAAFRRQHADALRAFPELDARMGNAQRASELLVEQEVARKAALDNAQRDMLGKLIGVTDPQDVTRVIGSIFGRADSIKQMMQLRAAIGDSPEAMQGLRKAVVDHMLNRFVSNTEAATSGMGVLKSDQLQTFINQNRGALKLAGFSDDELKTMANVAESLQQSNRSLTAVKIPGQSNTTQDVLATKANDPMGSTLLKALVTSASGTGTGIGVAVLTNPLLGAAAGVSVGVVSVLRQRGITKVDELIKEALLDPQLARTLMIKARPGNWRIAQQSLASRLRRGIAAGTAAAANDDGPDNGPVEITVRGGASR